MSARSTSTHPAQICSLSQNSVPANRLRKGWSSRTCSAHLHTALPNCKRANFSLLICKHVVKGLIGGYVGASSVAEADFGPYGNLGQVVKAVIALNVNDEKISHGLQLRLTVAQGEWARTQGRLKACLPLPRIPTDQAMVAGPQSCAIAPINCLVETLRA